MSKDIVEVSKSDLVFLHRALDTAFAEVEAAVADGLVDESVLIDMDEAMHILKEYLK